VTISRGVGTHITDVTCQFDKLGTRVSDASKVESSGHDALRVVSEIPRDLADRVGCNEGASALGLDVGEEGDDELGRDVSATRRVIRSGG
jgi:hypothetical protein